MHSQVLESVSEVTRIKFQECGRTYGLPYEQNRAPNFTRVSGQLLSVRRTTRARRVLDFTCGVSIF
jgi:hypothetical protein